jgi:transposase InsO family protein
VVDDETLVGHIREVLAEAEGLGWRGEGYRKVWARLRHRGIRTGQERVRRLMRAHGLQAPHRAGNPRGPRSHEGTIIPEAPNCMWGTDATQVVTRLEGTATIFLAVDHFVGDLVGIHAARPGTRFEALEPVYQGIREHFGPLSKDLAQGLVLRHDHGAQYMSGHFQGEIRFLGLESSPSFVRAPEGNGVAERFVRTLKEQLLWVRHFDTVEELRLALLEFKERYNRHWLLQRHGWRTPHEVRTAHVEPLPEAA